MVCGGCGYRLKILFISEDVNTFELVDWSVDLISFEKSNNNNKYRYY